jgi:cytochrome c553
MSLGPPVRTRLALGVPFPALGVPCLALGVPFPALGVPCLALGVLLLAAGAAAGEGADPRDALELAPGTREVLALEGSPEAGASTWQRCAVCHGRDGAGSDDGTFPQLAGQHRSVVVKQLVDIREGRRRNAVMEPFARQLIDAREIADVAAYVEALPIPRDNGKGPGVDPERGARLYGRDCATCHGRRGEGDAARFVPVLAGQHYRYLLRQIRAIAGGRRQNAHPSMIERTATYSDADLQAVVDHASRLEWPERQAPAPEGGGVPSDP